MIWENSAIKRKKNANNNQQRLLEVMKSMKEKSRRQLSYIDETQNAYVNY